jgi:hypothetical protein
LQHWQNYAEKLKQEGRNLAAVNITTHAIALKESHIIELPLTNPAMADIWLKDIRYELIAYFRKNLQNNNIQLRIIKATISEEAPRKIYTNQDKFKKLVEKFPIIADLRTMLGLDYDF